VLGWLAEPRAALGGRTNNEIGSGSWRRQRKRRQKRPWDTGTDEVKMGTTFVEIEGNGFWMADGTLEVFLRLVALQIPPDPDSDSLARRIRDQWLLASSGAFGGHVPHALEEFARHPGGREVVVAAIRGLGEVLAAAPHDLDAGFLQLLGVGRDLLSVRRQQLLEVATAFLDLLDGRMFGGAADGSFMPGTATSMRSESGSSGPS